ncbi:hypothetical protein OF381_10365 [Mannheimia haemolytica]
MLQQKEEKNKMENQEKQASETSIQINLRLKGELADMVKAMAEREDRTFAYIVQRLIRNALVD